MDRWIKWQAADGWIVERWPGGWWMVGWLDEWRWLNGCHERVRVWVDGLT